jgi:hypothetical protein
MDSFAGGSPDQDLSKSDLSEIRLVKLYPGEFDDQVRCELEHISLAGDVARDYIALSYTWGDPKITAPILLNGVQYPVTTNPHSFLRHAQRMLSAVVKRLSPGLRRQGGLLIHRIVRGVLEDHEFPRYFPLESDAARTELIHRHVIQAITDLRERFGSLGEARTIDTSQNPDPDGCYLYLWIDALCINQQDLAERSHQVRQMKDIYSQSSALFIWLEDPTMSDSDIGAAIQLVQDVQNTAREFFIEREMQFSDLADYLSSEDFARPRLAAVQQLRKILTHA